jgi:hypothetical protein
MTPKLIKSKSGARAVLKSMEIGEKITFPYGQFKIRFKRVLHFPRNRKFQYYLFKDLDNEYYTETAGAAHFLWHYRLYFNAKYFPGVKK